MISRIGRIPREGAIEREQARYQRTGATEDSTYQEVAKIPKCWWQEWILRLRDHIEPIVGCMEVKTVTQ